MIYAYLMALLEIDDQNEVRVRHFTITSTKHLACQLQRQAYACIDKHSGSTYHEAREALKDSVHSKMLLSQKGSLWHAIYNQLSREKM